jgi:hypothetical protein
MEFHQGRGNAWFLVAVCADDDDDKNEAFSLEIACERTMGFSGGTSPFPNNY